VVKLLDRPWTIVVLVVLYLVPTVLLVIDTAVHPGRPPLGWVYAIPVAFCVFSIVVTIGLWLRLRPAWIAALVFEVAVLVAIGVGIQMFLLTLFFWFVVFVAVVVGGYSGAVVWLLLAAPTRNWFARRTVGS
jgi:hypothetical protein